MTAKIGRRVAIGSLRLKYCTMCVCVHLHAIIEYISVTLYASLEFYLSKKKIFEMRGGGGGGGEEGEREQRM